MARCLRRKPRNEEQQADAHHVGDRRGGRREHVGDVPLHDLDPTLDLGRRRGDEVEHSGGEHCQGERSYQPKRVSPPADARSPEPDSRMGVRRGTHEACRPRVRSVQAAEAPSITHAPVTHGGAEASAAGQSKPKRAWRTILRLTACTMSDAAAKKAQTPSPRRRCGGGAADGHERTGAQPDRDERRNAEAVGVPGLAEREHERQHRAGRSAQAIHRPVCRREDRRRDEQANDAHRDHPARWAEKYRRAPSNRDAQSIQAWPDGVRSKSTDTPPARRAFATVRDAGSTGSARPT